MRCLSTLVPHLPHQGTYTFNHRSHAYIAEIRLGRVTYSCRASSLSGLKRTLFQALAQYPYKKSMPETASEHA